MALTKTPIELSSTPGIVDNSNATAITIDASENVGIGVTNPSDYYAKDLVIGAADEGGITIESAATEKTYLLFADGTSGDARYRGFIGYDHNIDAFNISSNGYINFLAGDTGANAERMRIDASGNVGIGNSSGVGKLEVYANNTAPAAYIRQDGTGPIQSWHVAGGTERMRILSTGGITFNGDTAQANALDDYEEGAWTPAFNAIGTGTYTLQVGRYTKVGNLVTAHFHLDINVLGTASGHLIITGLPFTATSVPANYGSMTTAHASGWSGAFTNLGGLVNPGTTTFPVYYQSSSGTVASVSHADMQIGNFLGTIIYEAA
jgi:hypothetical protein